MHYSKISFLFQESMFSKSSIWGEVKNVYVMAKWHLFSCIKTMLNDLKLQDVEDKYKSIKISECMTVLLLQEHFPFEYTIF